MRARNLAPPVVVVLALVVGPSLATADGVNWTRQPDGTLLVTGQGVAPRSSSRVSKRVPADLEALIERHAEGSGLEPDLVHAVIRVESGYDRWARSVDGAMGLMQLMPETAEALGVEDPWDPEQNIRGGTTYLARLLGRFDGRLDLALAGYNAGPEAVVKYDGVPPYRETQGYVETILRLLGGESELARWGGPLRRRAVFLSRSSASGLVVTTTPPAPSVSTSPGHR